MKNPEIAILAVLVAVLVAGWAVIQVDIYGGTSVKVTAGDDGTDVRIDGLLPSDYHYSIYSGADVSSELYYWYDESVECRSTHQMQSDFFDSMDALLKVRNHEAGKRVDTQALVEMMERELLLETYIKSLGYTDAVVSIGLDSDNVNVFVNADELAYNDFLTIYNILTEEAGCDPANVNIMPINSES